MFLITYVCAIKYYLNSKLKDRRYKQKTLPKSYKIEIKFLLILGQLNRVLNKLAQKYRIDKSTEDVMA